MIAQIKRQDCIKTYSKFPLADNQKEEFFFPSVYKSYFLSLGSGSRKGYIKKLSVELAALVKELGYDCLVFLGDTKTPWLHLYQRENYDFAPTKEAIQYLLDNKIGIRFNGGIEVDTTELPIFSKQIYTLTRVNSALPIIHFIDKGENILGSICQYGIIHFNTLNKKSDTAFKNSLKKRTNIVLIDKCNSPFGKV